MQIAGLRLAIRNLQSLDLDLLSGGGYRARPRAQLDVMPIRIDHIRLLGAVGPQAPRRETRLTFRQMLLPGIEIINQESVVIAPIVRDHRLLALADDVQLLVLTQPKPGPGKAERRPGNRREAQHIAIERDRPLDVGHVDGNVVKLGDVQAEWKGEW